MSHEYTYTGIVNEPNIKTVDSDGNPISGINYDVQNSDMTEKVCEFGTWYGATSILKLTMGSELSGSDKKTLDGIVEDNS